MTYDVISKVALPYFMKVIPSTHYLKKEYLDLHNFCFEITHTHLRQCGETSADLAANFKLTNHTAADFQIDQSYGYRHATEEGK